MADPVLQALVTVAFGALAGGLTNSVAIWMLFHPYEPPKLFGRPFRLLQGAIPKNQARLAAAVGRTVGNRLLTEEDLARTLAQGEFRQAFDERLSHFLEELFQRERGSLREILPPGVVKELEVLLDEALELGLARLQEFLASEAFEAFVAARTRSFLEAVGDQPVAELLTPVREEVLKGAVADWLENAVDSEGFQEAVEDYLARASGSLLAPGKTFQEVLPLGLVGALEKAIASYLPLALQRLGRLLEDPAARSRFQRTLHELFHRFLRDLNFYQRVVARLLVTEETLDRILDTIEREGAERLSEMLREPTVQEAMARGVNDAIVDFLRKPVASVLGGPDDPQVRDARATLAGWTVAMARDPATRDFLVEKMGQALERAGSRTWGEVLGRLPPETLTRALVGLARSEAAFQLYRRTARRLASGLLDRPLGTPARWLPPNTAQRLEQALGDPLWEWLQTQVPDVVHRLNVAGRVEEKVLHYPPAKMEELVRRVTDRELRLIVRLGYLLGAFVGLVLVVVNTLWR